MPTLDTRLGYLLGIQREAELDTRRYVLSRWPVGRKIRFQSGSLVRTGTVYKHDVVNRQVVVTCNDNVFRVRYTEILEPKSKSWQV